MSTSPTRVRFAPSPTGYLHVGSIRSALSNYLWARHQDGVFVLRIEDTDRARFVEDAEEQILASLDALGITPDEGPAQGGEYGPYRQSQRLDVYGSHATSLQDSGALYACWCSPERLDALRTAAQKAGVAFKYDRHCLVQENQKSLDEPHVLRFRIPDGDGGIGWDDAVRGRLDFKFTDLDDFVAVKADGFPTYHFANVVDDHLMAISHVLRADEWLPSTPKHLLLFEAFGWDAPVYAHLPAVLGPTGGKKLSKRDGAQSVSEYIAEGYLPEALMSFLASLGWNDGTTQEVFTPRELIEKFTLDRIQRSPAKFDKDRLTWMNGLLIRAMPLSDLLERSQGFWGETAAGSSPEYRLAVLKLVQERLKHLDELPELTSFFFESPSRDMVRTNLPLAKHGSDTVKLWLEAAAATVQTLADDFHAEALENTFRTKLLVDLGLEKGGPLFMSVRVALTGSTVSPGLFETMETLGAAVCEERLQQAILTL